MQYRILCNIIIADILFLSFSDWGIVMKEKEKKKNGTEAEKEKDPNQKEFSLLSNMVYVLKGTLRFQKLLAFFLVFFLGLNKTFLLNCLNRFFYCLYFFKTFLVYCWYIKRILSGILLLYRLFLA